MSPVEKTYPAETASISTMVDDAIQMLADRDINKKLLVEYRLLLEEIGIKMVEKAAPGAQFSLRMTRRTGVYSLKISCAGAPIVLERENEDDIGGRILEEYANCLGQSYMAGVNIITFSTSTPSNSTLYKCCISMLLASAVGAILLLTLPGNTVTWIDENILNPFVILFSNFMSTIAMPVAFFSLATFIISFQMSLDRDPRFLRLSIRYIFTSIVAYLVGMGAALLVVRCGFYTELTAYRTANTNFMGSSLRDLITSAVGSNIIEPFTLKNPLPMLTLAVIVGFAAANYFGPGGDTTRQAVNNVNAMFCKMLDLVYTTIPFFLFIAFLSGWLMNGFAYVKTLLSALVLIVLPMIGMLCFYALQVRFSGIRLRDFLRDYGDLIAENFKIGSNIQALPYNKRMLYRRTRVPGTFLYDGLKLGTTMNMDGNCLMIATFITVFVRACGISIPAGQYVAIFLVLLLVSVGAPNQPGSFLLVMVVLMDFMGISTQLYGYVLIIEAVTGKFYSFINSLGDVVTMIIEVHRLKKTEKV